MVVAVVVVVVAVAAGKEEEEEEGAADVTIPRHPSATSHATEGETRRRGKDDDDDEDEDGRLDVSEGDGKRGDALDEALEEAEAEEEEEDGDLGTTTTRGTSVGLRSRGKFCGKEEMKSYLQFQ